MNFRKEHYQKNNLAHSVSPYLRQHSANPVWWQEFSDEVLKFAEAENKPLLFSGGYSTCHWCHVMALDAFSHIPTAEFLNEHFVCIKIDREMRPDIDAWMMSYAQYTTGQGGWPLNVFVNHELKPFFAMMYAPSQEGNYGQPSFRRILEYVLKKYQSEQNLLTSWNMNDVLSDRSAQINIGNNQDEVFQDMIQYFDSEEGGVSGRNKFPPHNTLHYLLTLEHENEDIHNFVRLTLMKMATGGLHDHLQGGFYRYCTDPEWNIPHFEKMLYDQAMMLMNYSLAAHRYEGKEYQTIVKYILKCLDETFSFQGMYVSAHDADTDHEEGLTYLWDENDINDLLDDHELYEFHKIYRFIPFEGKQHLMRAGAGDPGSINEKLLNFRNEREQPFRDDKIITSWNALAGIGLIMAHRYVEAVTLTKAVVLFEKLIQNHMLANGLIAHSSYDGRIQEKTFLEDMASMLLFATYLIEHDAIDMTVAEKIYHGLMTFRKDDKWFESNDPLLGAIPASTHDHPYPSPVSLAEVAVSRFTLLSGANHKQLQMKKVLVYDYFNLAVKWSNGDFPLIESPDPIRYSELPAGIIRHKGNVWTICIHQSCRAADQEQIYQMLCHKKA